jgi:hypothetical protein
MKKRPEEKRTPMKKDKREAFIKATSSSKWQTVDQTVKALDEQGYWDDIEEAKATQEYKRNHVRRMLRSLKDEEGFPVFGSLPRRLIPQT